MLKRMDNVGIVVDDIEDVLARLWAHGAELVGELVQYEDMYSASRCQRQSNSSSGRAMSISRPVTPLGHRPDAHF